MALTGNEVLYVQGVTSGGSLSPVTQQTTTGAIAGLSGNGLTQDILNTNVTTVGAGTLLAAALLGGLITRSGPVAAFTDTTDTAAAIVTTIGQFSLNGTFLTTYKNSTAFSATLAAGAGVTLPLTNVVGPFQEIAMFGTVGGTAAAPTVTFTHLGTSSLATALNVTGPVIGALATVGAGVLTAALINDGYVSRAGAQANAAFTDTTDTGTAIVAGNPGLIGKIGSSITFSYQNTTNATATLTGGVGVTVSGITTVQAGGSATYVLTQTAANVLTMVGVLQTVPVGTNGTFTATGAASATVADTRITANSVVEFGLKTVGGTILGAPYMFTVTPGTGFTVRAGASDTSVYNYRIVG